MGNDKNLDCMTYLLYKWGVYDADFYYAYIYWYEWKKWDDHNSKESFLKRTSNKSMKWRFFYD